MLIPAQAAGRPIQSSNGHLGCSYIHGSSLELPIVNSLLDLDGAAVFLVDAIEVPGETT